MRYYLSFLPSLHLRFSFALNPLQVRSLEWEENGTYTDFGTDLLGTWKGGVGLWKCE